MTASMLFGTKYLEESKDIRQIGRRQKSLMSAFAYFLIAKTKILFLKGKLCTWLSPPNF